MDGGYLVPYKFEKIILATGEQRNRYARFMSYRVSLKGKLRYIVARIFRLPIQIFPSDD
jgi:hypothetical protein